MNKGASIFRTGLLLVFFVGVSGEAELHSFRFADDRQAVFADHTTQVRVLVQPSRPDRTRIAWRLSSRGRTLDRGETAVRRGGDAVEIPIATPRVKPGVVLNTVLEVVRALSDKGEADSIAKPLYVFPEDAFSGRREWLNQRNLVLFDPDGDTASLLEDADIPYEQTHNPDALLPETNQIIVAGADLSLQDHRALVERFLSLAEAGARVLVPMPSDGTFALPFSHRARGAPPAEIRFRGREVITDLNKKLDAADWPDNGLQRSRHLCVEGRNPEVGASICGSDEGWPWVELHYASGGRILFCGFPLFEEWDQSPTPRYLFVEILHWLHNPEETDDESNDYIPHSNPADGDDTRGGVDRRLGPIASRRCVSRCDPDV